MKLFQNLFAKDNSIEIGAPAAGKLVSIKEVSDPTFSEEVLGKGAAIIPADGKFYAPAAGTVSTIFPTGHAAAITSSEGVEILIHIGLDTVKLEGKHFTIHASEGQEVKKGDLLLEWYGTLEGVFEPGRRRMWLRISDARLHFRKRAIIGC